MAKSTKRKSGKHSATHDDKICVAAFALIGKEGWRALTLPALAKSAKLPLVDLQRAFPNKESLLPVLVGFVTRQTADLIGAAHGGSPHDRLFETMMARFDVLQTYRAAVIDLLKSARRDPAMIRYLLPAQHTAMRSMLVLAGLDGASAEQGRGCGLSIPFSVQAGALLGLYALILCVWQRDETLDMTKTMAALDKALRRSAQVMGWVDKAFEAVAAHIPKPAQNR